MSSDCLESIKPGPPFADSTRNLEEWSSASLARCCVDTPQSLVDATWDHVIAHRGYVAKVVEFGAGDGRFAKGGKYKEYIGYEIDANRLSDAALPTGAQLINRCAFSDHIEDADLCIGNPPFVRNQDLPVDWKREASRVLSRRTGVSISGLANAWQYFFLLALASLKEDGLCALIVPFEWVSRPASSALRDFISKNRWNVTVYRLRDDQFSTVLTTSSITIVDKSQDTGAWSYFAEKEDGDYLELETPSGSRAGVLDYLSKRGFSSNTPRAKRGLSPGTQKVLVLTEKERQKNALKVGTDVVPCVTSLRHLSCEIKELDDATFRHHYIDEGRKCWLIRTDNEPSSVLDSYLERMPAEMYQTTTCLKRSQWWKFTMPKAPEVLMAQGFKGEFPKALRNSINARAIGGVCGIHNLDDDQISSITQGLDGVRLRDRVVAYANGFRKIEINQINSLLQKKFGAMNGAT